VRLAEGKTVAVSCCGEMPEATTLLGSELELERRMKTQNTSSRTADLLGN
jgi:hypothetical protein